MGIMRMREASATRDEGPSCRYSMNMAPKMRSGEDMKPIMFWLSICRVSASLVTRLKTLPELKRARSSGDSATTFLKTSWFTKALCLYPVQAMPHGNPVSRVHVLALDCRTLEGERFDRTVSWKRKVAHQSDLLW